MKRVPKFIAEGFHDGSHGFRKSKRRSIRAILRQIDFLCLGCAYFPNGNKDVDILRRAAERIKEDVSVKKWGR